jgi:hypothetical protein
MKKVVDAYTTHRANKQVSLVFVSTPPSRPMTVSLAAIGQLDGCRTYERFVHFRRTPTCLPTASVRKFPFVAPVRNAAAPVKRRLKKLSG